VAGTITKVVDGIVITTVALVTSLAGTITGAVGNWDGIDNDSKTVVETGETVTAGVVVETTVTGVVVLTGVGVGVAGAGVTHEPSTKSYPTKHDSQSSAVGPEQVWQDPSQTFPQKFGAFPDNQVVDGHETHWSLFGPAQVSHDGSQTFPHEFGAGPDNQSAVLAHVKHSLSVGPAHVEQV
jgi:hypothetical protein